MKRIITGVALYSGGLDSILSIKLILDQGIYVEALIFRTLFFGEKINHNIPVLAGYQGLNFNTLDITQRFIDILVSPEHGYGKRLNPCIDCKILMLREAKFFMENMGADFVFTGEVLGQRPMSQRRDTLRLLEKKAGLEGILLRPLSAKLLPPTRMEEEGIIDRNKLLDLKGRSRKRQIEMAKSLKWFDFPTPGGGCLLTDKAYMHKLKHLLEQGKVDSEMIKWLKIGRHFILPCGTKVVVGRNQNENTLILNMAGKKEILMETVNVPGPAAVILGNPSKENIKLAASIMASYSDFHTGEQVTVALFKKGDFGKQMMISPLARPDIEAYRI
jgi:tRNA U34 2-thiouridine synthase MnmA/TrmU